MQHHYLVVFLCDFFLQVVVGAQQIRVFLSQRLGGALLALELVLKFVDLVVQDLHQVLVLELLLSETLDCSFLVGNLLFINLNAILKLHHFCLEGFLFLVRLFLDICDQFFHLLLLTVLLVHELAELVLEFDLLLSLDLRANSLSHAQGRLSLDGLAHLDAHSALNVTLYLLLDQRPQFLLVALEQVFGRVFNELGFKFLLNFAHNLRGDLLSHLVFELASDLRGELFPR